MWPWGNDPERASRDRSHSRNYGRIHEAYGVQARGTSPSRVLLGEFGLVERSWGTKADTGAAILLLLRGVVRAIAVRREPLQIFRIEPERWSS